MSNFFFELLQPLACNNKYNSKDFIFNNETIIKKEYVPLFLLYVDSMIWFNIYFGIIQIIYPFINNRLAEPSIWFSCFLFITLWFFWLFIGKYLNNRKL